MAESNKMQKIANRYAGKKLRELRGEESQPVFAARIGMKQRAYSMVELGQTPLTIPRLVLAAQVYDVPLSYFILPDDDPAWDEAGPQTEEAKEGTEKLTP